MASIELDSSSAEAATACTLVEASSPAAATAVASSAVSPATCFMEPAADSSWLAAPDRLATTSFVLLSKRPITVAKPSTLSAIDSVAALIDWAARPKPPGMPTVWIRR